MQWPPHATLLSFSVQLGALGQGVGVEFDDGVQTRAGAVQGGNALEVHPRQLAGAQLPAAHGGLKLSHAAIQQ